MDGPVAEHYSKFTDDRLSSLIVLPPWEPRDKSVQWVRGFLRYNNGDAIGPRDFVVTGPRLRIVYGGCRWSRLVLAISNTTNDESTRFRDWLLSVSQAIRDKIWSDPKKYRPGSVGANRFTFDEGFIKKSSDPALYPDELSTRLSTTRITNADTEEPCDLVDAQLFADGPDGPIIIEDLNTVTAGSYVTPIFRVSYNRFNDRFGLVLTVLRAKYEPSDKPRSKTENSAWVFDDPMETTN